MPDTVPPEAETETAAPPARRRPSAKASVKTVRTRASAAVGSARDGVGKTAQAARRSAKRVGNKSAEALDTSPLALLVGGLAAGAIAGGLLPRTQAEARTLGAVGRRVNETAAAAARAAKAAGQDQLSAAGINGDTAKSQLSTLVDGLIKAFVEAGSAAASEVKRPTR